MPGNCMNVIRDIEIEAFLREVTTPVLIQANLVDQYPIYDIGNTNEQRAPDYRNVGTIPGGKALPVYQLPTGTAYDTSGVKPMGIYSQQKIANKITLDFVLIDSTDLNAWVSQEYGNTIFVTTGLIMSYPNTSLLVDIIAHEVGHIIGRHTTFKQIAAGQAAKKGAIASSLIGIASIMSGMPAAYGAIGGLAGGSSFGLQSSLAFSQTLEKDADLKALVLLERAGITSRGMYDFMNFVNKKTEGMSEFYQFFQTHPLSQYRMQTISNYLFSEDKTRIINNEKMERKFGRVQAKIRGYFNNMQFIGINPDVKQKMTTFDEQYEKMYQHFAKYEYEKVIEIGEILMRQSNADIYIAEVLGQAYCALSNMSEAKKYFQIVRSKFRNNQVIEYEYGSCLVKNGDESDFQNGLNIINAIRTTNPQDIISRTLLMDVAKKANRKDLYFLSYAEVEVINKKKQHAIELLNEIITDPDFEKYPLNQTILEFRRGL